MESKNNDTNKLMHKTEIDPQTQKTNSWLPKGKLGEGDIRSLGLADTAAEAAAKSLQSCPTLCNPIDGSPLGSLIPGILQARTLEWVAISFSSA